MLISTRPRLAGRVLTPIPLLSSTVISVFFFYLWFSYGHRPSLLASTLGLPSPSSLAPLDTTIPKKLWYKLGPSGLNAETREWTRSCIEGNPGYQAEFFTDASGDAYVEKMFADRPDIVSSYLDLTIPIVKADLLRYLILFAEGGTWSDLDVSCEVPMDKWIPSRFQDQAGMVVGWEFDGGLSDAYIRQFASWTIMAKPRLNHLDTVIRDIVQAIQDVAIKHNVSVAEIKLNMIGDVVDFTGPRRLTRGVMKSVEQQLNRTVDIHTLSNITQPKMIEDVLIMPGFAFAASTNTYDAQVELGPTLVTHHYAGSWKNEHGGELA
ncbi:hypothetical protein BX600DRAFT_510750 [Xylariales sp. PMI_506]|nr:hypothetical protein BX600DRAFT_510750 [Xylariales sp. PMI_506]